jgi:hypothetical protein
MIKKQDLQSVISKYHLNGLIDSVKWVTTETNFNVNFMSPNNDMLGSLSYNNTFLPTSEVAIYNTSQLNKLLGITSGDLEIDLTKGGKIYTKLLVSDSNCNLSYALADIMLIPRVATLNEPDGYEIEAELSSEHIDFIIKYKNAIQSDLVDIEVIPNISKGDHLLQFTFGEGADHANKIQYSIPCSSTQLIDSSKFASDILKEILVSNKDMDNAKLYISEKGLIKLEFTSNDINSKYFLVQKEEA